LKLGLELLHGLGAEAEFPGGGFYLWCKAPGGDAWAFAREIAETSGVIVSPGEFYGKASPNYVRFAAVQPTADLQTAVDRLGTPSGAG